MGHPRRYDDGDPVLVRLRAVALAFPAATEVEAHGLPTFRAGRVFAVYGQGERGREHPRSLVVRPDEEDRAALEQDPRAYRPAYLGASGWIGIDLDGPGAGPGSAAVDWQEVAELLDSSYRAVAPPALLRRLDAEGGPAGRPPSVLGGPAAVSGRG